MKKNQNSCGMIITNYIRERMETYRTGGDSDQPLSYMEVVQGLGISHQTWFRLETGKITNCSWDTWTQIYNLLVRNELIDPNDIRLMPPEILRQKLLKNDLKSEQINSFYLTSLFSDIFSEIMLSDMCDSCKVKAYKIINKYKIKEPQQSGNNSEAGASEDKSLI